MARLTLFFAVGLWLLTSGIGARADTCRCANVNARSDSSTGVCHVREYHTTACELVWGPEPKQQVRLIDRLPVSGTLNDLSAIGGKLSPAPTGQVVVPQLEGIREGAGFWREVAGTVQQRSFVEGDLYAQSLSFLSQKGEAVERPHIAVGAVFLLLAAGLGRPLADLPILRQTLLREMLTHRHHFARFSGPGSPGGDGRLETEIAVIDPQGRETRGRFYSIVQFGCVEILFEPLRLAQLVKTPWSVREMTRCR